jgi:hypothetical protein
MQNRKSIFCTGWKPFSGWVLGIALLYHFIIYHTLCWVWSLLVAFKTISARAKGLFCYVLSLPDNWYLVKKEIITHFSEGRDAMNKAFKELENKGYIKSKQERLSDNRITYTYVIDESPETGFQGTETQCTENQHLLSTDGRNTDKQSTKVITSKGLSKSDYDNLDEYSKVVVDEFERIHNKRHRNIKITPAWENITSYDTTEWRMQVISHMRHLPDIKQHNIEYLMLLDEDGCGKGRLEYEYGEHFEIEDFEYINNL